MVTSDIYESSPDLDIGPDFVYLDIKESSVCTSGSGTNAIILTFSLVKH